MQRVDTNASTDLRFVTVRNSGHMTPKYAPLKTWKIVDTVLLQGAPLAPPLPADWRTSTDEAFYAYDSAPNATSFGDFTSWVVDAMKQA